MIESFKFFARKSPLIAGILIGAVAVCILFLLGSLLTGPKTEFGSAAAILKEDYLQPSNLTNFIEDSSMQVVGNETVLLDPFAFRIVDQ